MDSPLHGFSPVRQFASASNIHSSGGQSHEASGPTPMHSSGLASSPMRGDGSGYNGNGKQQHFQHSGSNASARRLHPKSPFPPRNPSNKQRHDHRPTNSLDFTADLGHQSAPSVSKHYRREDRQAAAKGSDTITTAQETMSNYHSGLTSSSLSASASGSNPANNNGVRRHEDQRPILIPTHHHAEQYQGIEVFCPQAKSERSRRHYNEGHDEHHDDDISDASSISTAISALAQNDPQQRQVKITGIQRAIRNYEIIEASSSESTDEEKDDVAQSKAKSLLDAATFSAETDDDEEYRRFNKMSDQTKMFQEWHAMGMSGGDAWNTSNRNVQDTKASWMWKPAPLEIPATLERQSDGRGGLLSSLRGGSSSRRSLLSRGLVPDESSKTIMAENNRGIEQKYFRQHFNSAQEFLQSAEKLEQRAQKREEEERVRIDRDSDEAADGGVKSILRMVGESFFKCTGH